MTLFTIQVIDGEGVLQTINYLPPTGQVPAASSLPVVIASDQSALPVTTTGSATSTGATNQVSVASTATVILGSNALRKGANIVNDGTATIFLGFTSSVTAATGLQLASGSSFVIDTPLYIGGVWGIVATGTQTASYAEWT